MGTRGGDGAAGAAVVRLLTAGEDDSRTREAAGELGLRLPTADRSTHRRPSATVTEDEIGVVLLVLAADRSQHPLRLHAGPSGLLAVGDDTALTALGSALVDGARVDDTRAALAAALVAVARHSEDALDAIDDEAQDLATRATGYTSSPERRVMRRLRTDLFRIGEAQAALHTLLSPDEELALALGDEHRRLVARAASAFGADHSTATRLYAMLGDVLAEQDTVVSERLTLVATIFMPLTLTTGFFGMNFAWMTDRIGSLPAFLILGLAVPAVMVLGTLALVRRLTRAD